MWQHGHQGRPSCNMDNNFHPSISQILPWYYALFISVRLYVCSTCKWVKADNLDVVICHWWTGLEMCMSALICHIIRWHHDTTQLLIVEETGVSRATTSYPQIIGKLPINPTSLITYQLTVRHSEIANPKSLVTYQLILRHSEISN